MLTVPQVLVSHRHEVRIRVATQPPAKSPSKVAQGFAQRLEPVCLFGEVVQRPGQQDRVRAAVRVRSCRASPTTASSRGNGALSGLSRFGDGVSKMWACWPCSSEEGRAGAASDR